jgi:polysaccharide export outer membrane protein
MYCGLFKGKKPKIYLYWAGAFSLMILLFSSCKVSQKTTYFNKLTRDTTINSFSYESLEFKIEKNDLLRISVSSLNHELDEKFNAAGSGGMIMGAMNLPNSSGFLVDNNGEVILHFLGKTKVEGLTKDQLVKKIQNDLIPFMKEPIVNVEYLNKKITVFGELGAPRVLNIYDQHTTLLDALVLSGDLKENALITDLIMVRDSASKKLIKHINLEDHSLFSSDYYYVKPNDIIYVKKDNRTLEKEEKRRSFQSNLSLIVSFISLGVIIINTLKK